MDVSPLLSADNIAIVALAVMCGILGAANVAQWIRAMNVDEQHRADLRANDEATSRSIDKMAAVIESMRTMLAIITDRLPRT